jgi:hypothetical protein
MRISVKHRDPGYLAWVSIEPDVREKIVVTLDGKRIENVIMADEALCVATVARLDEHGLPYAENYEVATETLRGEISITVPTS